MKLTQILLGASVCVVSTAQSITVDEIRRNYEPLPNLNDDFVSTPTDPGWQKLGPTPPAITWQPKVDLNNAFGAPRIELKNAFGDIKHTSGVSDDVKDYVDEALGNDNGGGGGWEVIYSGAGTNSINTNGHYTQWRASYSWTEAQCHSFANNKCNINSAPKFNKTGNGNGIYGNASGAVYEAIFKGSYSGPSSGCGFSEVIRLENTVKTSTTMRWNSELSKTNGFSLMCGYMNGSAKISNFKITKFEVIR